MLLQRDAERLDIQERREVLNLLPSFEGKTVLDLGAGIGRFTNEFAKKAKKITAVDLCPHFIEANKEANWAHNHIEWICKDALDVDFEPQQFDLIFLYGVLMYLPEEEVQTLSQKMFLWIKPKGVLFFVESCAAVTHFTTRENYYAHYRSSLDYDRLFKNWRISRQGNLQAHEDLLADPFRCFWALSKS